MRSALILATGLLAAAGLACASTPATLPPPLETSIFDGGRTAYGFFPSPPKPTFESVLETFQAMGDHGDVVLIQQNILWEAFVKGPDGESQAITDIRNQVILARQNGLEAVFVVDPLNGLKDPDLYPAPRRHRLSACHLSAHTSLRRRSVPLERRQQHLHRRLGRERLVFVTIALPDVLFGTLPVARAQRDPGQPDRFTG